ncbi:MAG: hypothetical protein IKB82_03570, partial [Clostridia bacterium]|nr:hypothetical protein [Clostridia bacterium]
GTCGIFLLRRLTRVVCGQEYACGARKEKRNAPLEAIALAMLAALLSRLLLYVLAYAMHRFTGGAGTLMETLPRLWMHWDTRHYVNIAQNGYTAVGDERLQLVFFPLYPLLMRAFSLLTGGDVFSAGLLLSNLCAAGCAGLLFDLAYGVLGRRGAWLSLAYFLLSPLSVFLCCAYTEALFICLTLGAMALLRRGHPWLAAVCGMLSAFTRMPGVIVSGLFIIAAIGRYGQGKLRGRDVLACVSQVLIVFLGLFAYWAINWLVTGDPFMYLIYQKENWFQQAGSFWNTVDNTTYYVLSTVGDGDWLYTWGFQLLCIFYVFYLLCFGQKKLPFDLAAYSYVYVAVVLAPTWLLSGARYLYALAPLPMLQARMHKGGFFHALALTLSTVLLVIWTFGYTIAIEVL